MQRMLTLLTIALAMLALAAPAALAQDPYITEVLVEGPEDEVEPAPPEEAPGIAEEEVVREDPEVVREEPADVVPAQERVLAVTGFDLTVWMALLAAALLGLGTTALLIARRRTRVAD